jgi:PHD/YefM family antitoxin component YafN of YafNO toxin-antitoxin module
MITTHEEYIIDKDGERKAVILPWEEWQAVLEELEELDDIRAYDEAKLEPSDPLPFEQVVREIREAKLG